MFIFTWRKLVVDPTSTKRLLSPKTIRAFPDFKICNFPNIPSFKWFKVQNLLVLSVSLSFTWGTCFWVGSFCLSSFSKPGRQSGNYNHWRKLILNLLVLNFIMLMLPVLIYMSLLVRYQSFVVRWMVTLHFSFLIVFGEV